MMAHLLEEEENYVRLALLLEEVSPRAVRTYFDREFPPTHLPSTLNTNYNTLLNLKSKRVLNQAQWNLLFPSNGVPVSTTFDVTLMICLIRNLTSVTQPIKGFDSLPLPAETTPGPDLARIKWYRNILVHNDSNKMATDHFNTAWSNISDAVRRLGGLSMNQECRELKVKILSESNQEILLKIKQSREKINIRQINIRQTVGYLMKSHGTLQTELTEVTELLKDLIPRNIRDLKAITEFTYSCNAFTRCNFLRKRYDISENYFNLLKVRVLHKQGYPVNRTEFAVEKDTEPTDIYDDGCLPSVNVCILQSDKDIGLTVTDKDILKHYMEYYSKEAVVFMIHVDEDITDLQCCAVSKQIEGELEVNEQCNDILHRLFHRKTDGIASGIAIRLSMLFEKKLIDCIKPLIAKSDSKSVNMVKEHNELDLQYHQLKCVSLRNELICEFGYERNEKGKLFVAIENHEHEIDVKDYLRTFLPNASDIEIVEFKEIEIENMALKSGDKVTHNLSYGTVGLCLTDGTHYFCATCKHVIDDVDTNNSNVIITNSQEETFQTDHVLQPSNNLDFVAIRLSSNRIIPITYGLKNQFSRFVDGCIFGNDMMIPHEQHVYKWGASSNLTNGNFSRIKERRNLPATVEIKCVELTDFSSPGDSGSLICYSEAGFEIAAFVLIGCARNDVTLSVGYKLADAMNACKTCIHPDITACINLDNELFK